VHGVNEIITAELVFPTTTDAETGETLRAKSGACGQRDSVGYLTTGIQSESAPRGRPKSGELTFWRMCSLPAQARGNCQEGWCRRRRAFTASESEEPQEHANSISLAL